MQFIAQSISCNWLFNLIYVLYHTLYYTFENFFFVDDATDKFWLDELILYNSFRLSVANSVSNWFDSGFNIAELN